MSIATRIGSSLLALAVAVPAVGATATPAEAQSLIDRLFRQPAQRQRVLRDRQLRRQATRPVRRTVRRQRVAPRRATVRRASSRPTRRASRPAPRRAPVAVIKAPTFFDYRAEPMVRLSMAGISLRIADAIAEERAELEANPVIRHVAPASMKERRAERPLAHLSAKAMMAPARNAEGAHTDVTRTSVSASTAEPRETPNTPTIAPPGPETAKPVAGASAERPVAGPLTVEQRVNEAALSGQGGFDPLDAVPVFEVVRDPRLEQLAVEERVWRAFESASARATEPVAQAVATHYEDARELLWTDGERVRPAARQVIRVLRDAASYGLDPSEYVVPPVPSSGAPVERHMAFELALTVAALQYVKDASAGRVIADRLSGYHDLPRRDPKLLDRVAELADAASPADVLLDAHPDTREFGLLRDRLAELRGEASDPMPTLPPGGSMRAGQADPRAPVLVEILRRVATQQILDEHADALAAYDGGETIPTELDGLIRAVQAQKGLRADGIVGPRTAAKLRPESVESKIRRVELAMERSRWLPHEFAGESGEYVMINAAAYRVQHVVNDEVDLSMRVVVGKKGNQTNFFYDELEHIEFNPDWAVPRSIVVNEYLPKLRSNPGWLDAKGWEVRDSRGRKVRSSSVNWSAYGADVPFSVRQPSSSTGALGELKIEFPNRHAIYMHDTPAKNLFSRETRAYSHGCVRLAEPRRMAAAMLGTTEADVADRIRTGGHHNAPIDRDIPVYVSYFTAWPTDSGEIGFYADVYGRDEALVKALAKTDASRESEGEEWSRIPVPTMRAMPRVYTLADEVEELQKRLQWEAYVAPEGDDGSPLPRMRDEAPEPVQTAENGAG